MLATLRQTFHLAWACNQRDQAVRGLHTGTGKLSFLLSEQNEEALSQAFLRCHRQINPGSKESPMRHFQYLNLISTKSVAGLCSGHVPKFRFAYVYFIK